MRHRRGLAGIGLVCGLIISGAAAPAAAAAASPASNVGGTTITSCSPSPQVCGVSPGFGPASGGTFIDVATSKINPKGAITITGTGFKGATAVLFDMSGGTVTVPISTGQVNAAGTQIHGVIPPPDASAEGVSIQVATPKGTSPQNCSVIQAGCLSAYFFLKWSHRSQTVGLDSLNKLSFPITTSRPAGSGTGGIVHECGTNAPPSSGSSLTGSATFGPTVGATLTGSATTDEADNASLPSAFLGNVSVTLNQAVQITVSLAGQFGDCIDIKTPLTLFDVVGVDIVLEPLVSGSVSYTLTMAPGTYTIREGGWMNGKPSQPKISLSCPGATACLTGSAPSWNVQAKLIAGPMLRIGFKIGTEGAYVEAGPAVGLAAGIGSAGPYAEACGGAVWDAHITLGIDIGAGGPLLGPYQLAGTGDGYPTQQCPLAAIPAPKPVVTSINPTAGPASGRTPITVQGANFGFDSKVDFGSAKASNVAVDPSGTKLTATSPPGTGTVYVTVRDQGGTSAKSAAAAFTYGVALGAGAITLYPGISAGTIAAGPDGALWFTNGGNNWIGRITTAGAVTAYFGTGISTPNGITAGPDGALWFTTGGNNSIGRITTAGAVTTYGISLPGGDITAGPDGALWFASDGSIGRITTAGTVTIYTDSSIGAAAGITAGPDGALWFTSSFNNSIGRITTAGAVTIYTGTGISDPQGITAGPDGALWFANQGNGSGNSIGRISTAGAVTTYTDNSIRAPAGITAGRDGALWFTNSFYGSNSIGRITTAGAVTTYTDSSIRFDYSLGEITAGPDGALWFIDDDGASIGRITTAGAVAHYIGTGISYPQGITAGPDGALWFTNSGNGDQDASIGRITTAGAVTSYTGIGISEPHGIAAGPDGALWFTNDGNSIGRITTAGIVTTYTGTGIDVPTGITAGSDGALWFTNDDSIGRITTAGAVTDYYTGIGTTITAGPDGALWFTSGNSIGRITTAGAVTTYTDSSISGSYGIAAGPDGALWFTNDGNNSIGRITTAGIVTTYTGTGISEPYGITAGPDRALWFTNGLNNSIGRITTAGAVTNYPDTGGISHPYGITAGPDGAVWFTNDDSIGRITSG